MRVQVEKLEKNMAKLTIEVSAEEFEAAIEKAKSSVGDSGMFLDSSVIARPDDQIIKNIV